MRQGRGQPASSGSVPPAAAAPRSPVETAHVADVAGRPSGPAGVPGAAIIAHGRLRAARVGRTLLRYRCFWRATAALTRGAWSGRPTRPAGSWSPLAKADGRSWIISCGIGQRRATKAALPQLLLGTASNPIARFVHRGRSLGPGSGAMQMLWWVRETAPTSFPPPATASSPGRSPLVMAASERTAAVFSEGGLACAAAAIRPVTSGRPDTSRNDVLAVLRDVRLHLPDPRAVKLPDSSNTGPHRQCRAFKWSYSGAPHQDPDHRPQFLLTGFTGPRVPRGAHFPASPRWSRFRRPPGPYPSGSQERGFDQPEFARLLRARQRCAHA